MVNNNMCRIVEAEMKDLGHRWGTIKRLLAKDWTLCRKFVADLNADGRKTQKVMYHHS